MLNVNHNLKIVRASAWYDLAATAAFMTPWSASLCLQGFAALSAALGLDRPVPVLGVSEMLFVNLLGSVVIVWSLWRLRHPSRLVGLYDVLARGLFALWQIYAVAKGASFLILGFTFMEVAFAIAQSLPVSGAERGRDRSGGSRGEHVTN
ncbi:hypothetical protein ACIPO9_08685 [Pseudomonas sp. NPDC090203]|uniref:hypothetical protein n=1 Tax=unclassified Pseudomonas TaxID=196821 RepID=UPI003807709A